MPQNNFEERIKADQKGFNRLRAVYEIKNLVGRYGCLYTVTTLKEIVKLFAQKQPDVSAEIGNLGKWIGIDAINTLYTKVIITPEEPPEGLFLEHTFVTPGVQVAGDLKTAKGVWFSVGSETIYLNEKPTPTWVTGKYEADFIKEDGEWKIWHWHYYTNYQCDFYKSWLDMDPIPPKKILEKYPPTEPTTYHDPYTRTRIQAVIPAFPEPYETWGK